MGETTILIPPNGIFLGLTETDMIALEREGWAAEEPSAMETNSG